MLRLFKIRFYNRNGGEERVSEQRTRTSGEAIRQARKECDAAGWQVLSVSDWGSEFV